MTGNISAVLSTHGRTAVADQAHKYRYQLSLVFSVTEFKTFPTCHVLFCKHLFDEKDD